jgi:hypothetical protein
MQICPYCGHENAEGETYCKDCGQNISADRTISDVRRTRSIAPITSPTTGDMPRTDIRPEAGTFVIHIGNDLTTLPLFRPLTLGRGKTSLRMTDMFDLDPYDAYHKGVSRNHAEIRPDGEGGIVLVDLGSMNGTYLNKHRLEPNQPYPLFGGDSIQVGDLRMHVYI